MMDNKTPQYQRAVTPTIDSSLSPSLVKGKVLSYNANLVRNSRSNVPASDKLYGSMATGIGASASSRNIPLSPRSTSGSTTDVNVQGRISSSNTGKLSYGSYSHKQGATLETTATSYNTDSLAPALSVLPRYDLVPLSDELPGDGIIFAKTKTSPEVLVVFRTPEERLRNPERLNLDRRQLEVCPLLEQEQRLRLLNFQNNNIRCIQNLENLPNLIFLDLYNNKIASLEGPLSTVKGLRVLMAGKNKITNISNLQPLRKLDVLDLHSNEIRSIEGLDGLSDLRVLNLAGNRINVVNNLSSLVSLTELNLRRNNIGSVTGLNQLPALQRVFLSHNSISRLEDIACLFEINYLIELSLDGNPLSEGAGTVEEGKGEGKGRASSSSSLYRSQLVAGMPGLRHLDLKRVTEEERAAAVALLGGGASALGGGRTGATSASAAGNSITHSGDASIDGRVSAGLSDYDAADTTDGKNSSDDDRDGDKGRDSSVDGDIERADSRDREDDVTQSRSSAGASAGGTAGAASSGGRAVERKGLQKYVNVPSDIPAAAASSGGNGASGASFAGIAVAGSAYEQQQQQSQPPNGGAGPPAGAALNSKGGSGLAALARAGKLFNTQSIFDLEIIGPDEKALIAVGDNWEWTPTKRLLLNVTEASFYHMKRQTLLNKMGSSQLASLPALKCLRLVFNDFSSLKNVEFIPALYGKQIEQLVLRNCPLCASASPELLRGFFTASMPRLTSFNEVEIGAQERQQAEALYGPMIRVLRLTSAETVQQQNQRLGISSSGSANANTGVATNKLVSKSAAAAAPSLLKAHQKQSTRNAGQGGILLSLSAGLGLQRDAAQSQSRTAGPPLVPPAASSSFSSSSSPSCTPCSSVGSRTADLLRAAASGQVPASATTVSNSTSTAATADAQGAPLALSQRSLYRRSAQAQFAAAFDEAFKRIVFETVAEIKQS